MVIAPIFYSYIFYQDKFLLITRIRNYAYKMIVKILECLLGHDLTEGLPKKINPVGIIFIDFKIGPSYCCVAVLLWALSKLNFRELATRNVVEETGGRIIHL